VENIPEIAKKLLKISCEYHQNSGMENLFIPVAEIVNLYQEKEGTQPEKNFYLALEFLEERKFIRVKKRTFTRMPDLFDITANGFEEVNT